jgi:general secretion pathway protein F
VPRFAFEAIDRNGTILRGTLEGANQSQVLEQLLALGRTPVSVKLQHPHADFFRGARKLFGASGFDHVSLLRELGTLLKAGLPVERALTALIGLSSDHRTKLRVQQIVERVRNGEPLSQAFAGVVTEAPPHLARLLAAGEVSGHLPDVTERVAAGLIRVRKLKTRLITDLTYPAILLFAVIAVFWVVFHTVLPRLAPMFSESGVALPLPTQILLSIGGFFDTYGWPLLALLIGGLAAAGYNLTKAKSRLYADRLLLNSRLTLGIPREFAAALFCRNLQTMLDGGLPLDRALGTARDGTANRWFKNQLTEVQKCVANGERLSRALSQKAPVLPPLVPEFCAVGEETGRLAVMMREVADLLEESVQTRLNRLTTLVVPVTTLVMGVLVAGLMAGIVSGILAVNDLAR